MLAVSNIALMKSLLHNQNTSWKIQGESMPEKIKPLARNKLKNYFVVGSKYRTKGKELMSVYPIGYTVLDRKIDGVTKFGQTFHKKKRFKSKAESSYAAMKQL